MKYLLAAAVLIAGLCSTADASIWYRVTFTGETLLNNVFVDGADGSTAADNDLYDGARLLEDARTFVGSEHSTFREEWNVLSDAGYTFNYFNFFGLDGRGANWGEDYKPFEILSASGPEGWFTGIDAFPEGYSPGGHHTLDYPYWLSWPEDGLPLGRFENGVYNPDPSLSDYVFSVDLLIDPNDEWWGRDTQGSGEDSAPNDWSSQVTFWFGGYFSKDDENMYTHMFQGNFIAGEPGSAGTPQVIPEPSSIAIWSVIGVVGLGIAYRRRRRQ